MKDLRPPTLQTYTDKTYKYTLHMDNRWYTCNITWTLNTYMRILAKKKRLCNLKTDKKNWRVYPYHHLTPTGFNCHGAGIWTVVCSNKVEYRRSWRREEKRNEKISPPLLSINCILHYYYYKVTIMIVKFSLCEYLVTRFVHFYTVVLYSIIIKMYHYMYNCI